MIVEVYKKCFKTVNLLAGIYDDDPDVVTLDGGDFGRNLKSV